MKPKKINGKIIKGLSPKKKEFELPENTHSLFDADTVVDLTNLFEMDDKTVDLGTKPKKPLPVMRSVMHYKRIQEEKSKIKDRDLVRLYLAEKQEEKKKTEKVQQQKRKTRPLAQVKKKNMSKDEAKRERVNTILQEALTGKRKGSKTYKKIEKEGFFQYITMVSRQETFRSKAKRFFFVTGFICLFFLIFLLTNIIMHLVLEYLKRN
jgi:hypothetical protein